MSRPLQILLGLLLAAGLTAAAGHGQTTSRLINFSIRSTAGTGAQTLIVGFVAKGSGKNVLVRGIGPTLTGFGVSGALVDPQLGLYTSASALLRTNDNWGAAGNATQVAAIADRLGAFALATDSRDAALLQTLDDGAFTAQISGSDAATGIALAEIYDADSAPAPAARLVNVSARTQVGIGESILIAGFVIGGEGPRTILLRGVGPALSSFGVGGALANPQLKLYADETLLAQNDNWDDDPSASQIAETATVAGAFALPASSRDAVLLATLPPGRYSAHVSGVNATTGVALVEAYEIGQATAPTLSLPAGAYAGPVTVALTAANRGATIRYTLDGSTPSVTQGTLYTGPIALGSTATLAAVATLDGLSDSAVTRATYTLGALAPDFALALKSSPQPAPAGTSLAFNVTVTASGGFAGAVTLRASGLPTGTVATFTPATVTGSGKSTLTVTTTGSVPVSTYMLTVTGSSGATTRTAASSLTLSPAVAFRHPGITVNLAQLDLIKSRVAAGVEPQKTAFATASASKYGALVYTPTPWKTVECGAYSNPNNGCSDENIDAAAAYTQALLWYITGNDTYAKNSIKIMNAWASTLTGGHTHANAPLQAGWTGAQWPRAAEIIRYTYPGWSADEIARFETMLRTQYLPSVINGSCQVGNWELSIAEALLNIAIFLNDRPLFDKAIGYWRGRVPAYFYLTSDGATPRPPGHCSAQSWYGASTYVDGLCQETCRDLGHTQYGIASSHAMAEAALQQGIDLYAEEATRLISALEFHAQYLNGAAIPNWLCGGKLTDVTTYDTWEIAYNHFHERLGLSLPQTQILIGKNRPTGVDHHMLWETLTHGGIGNVGLP
ncbi:MAG: alginate lyase family protein [Opitutae bacterium]|nr:alginate lyase family protein [Opitutae bacterium]